MVNILYAIPLLWPLIFLLIPMLTTLGLSFLTRDSYGGLIYKFTLDNYVRALDPLYLGIFFRSLSLAAITAISCLIVAWPMAFAMTVAGPKWQKILFTLTISPFLINFVVRIFSLKFFMGAHGPVVALLQMIGAMDESGYLTDNTMMVWAGMLINYLPFMVLPLFSSFSSFDFTLLDAAKDLGAGRRAMFMKVFFPLTKEGVYTGLMLVFMPALGEYVIPDMLGGSKSVLIGNVITEQFLKSRNWPFGSALSSLLIFIIALGIFLNARFKRREALT